MSCTCEVKDFGHAEAGDAKLYILRIGDASVTLTNFGARIVSAVLPDKNGNYADVVLGYDTVQEYESQGGCLGSFVGRCANRLAGGDFTLNGKHYKLFEKTPGFAIHGGKIGFDKKIWGATPVELENGVGLRLTYLSKDGEENYPGNLNVEALYTFTADKAGSFSLTLEMNATSDADTLANFTNHVYFNLAGHDADGGILSHELTLNSNFYTPTDDSLCPTGAIAPVTDVLDFSKPRVIGKDINDPSLAAPKGYDHNFVLNKTERGALDLGATLDCHETGRRLELFTTLPGVQLYTSNSLTPRKGKNGAQYGFKQGVCLEPQLFPNAMRVTHFPSPILRAGEKYHHVIVWKFSTKE